MKNNRSTAKPTLLALQNLSGQTVRTYEMHTEQAALVYRLDSKRVELLADTTELDNNDVSYQLLSKISQKTLGAENSVPVAGVGYLRKVATVQTLSKDISLAPENNSRFKEILRYTALGHMTLLLIFLLFAYFFFFIKQTDEPQVVTIFKQRPEAPTVDLSPEKVVRTQRPIAKNKVTKKTTRRVIRTAKKSVSKNKKQNISSMGALDVLGQLTTGKAKGGINLGAANATSGVGRGGRQGSGGSQTSIYSKGLVATNVGPGSKAYGAGGYGTKGQGGGKSGYGRISLSGASSQYVQPLEEMASVYGGLDRDQVAEVIRRHQGQIVYCYEKGLQVKPSLKGRIDVKFVIGTQGYVSTARVSQTSVGSSTVENCIVQKLRSWKFPKPVGDVNVKVEYPFTFKRVSQG